MVFVTVGTEKFSFDRLIIEIDDLVKNGFIRDKVFMQIGSSKYEPRFCEWKRFLPFGAMVQLIKDADIVISHAASTFFVCLQAGKKPILVPRKKEFKEHVDDHQVIFAEKMREMGYDRIIFDINGLSDAITACSKTELSEKLTMVNSAELIRYLDNLMISWEKC